MSFVLFVIYVITEKSLLYILKQFSFQLKPGIFKRIRILKVYLHYDHVFDVTLQTRAIRANV